MKISNAVRFTAVFGAALFLTACGGGGGGGSPSAPIVTPPAPPVTVSITVTCPNGSQTTATGADMATATAAANAACPTPKMVSITPVNGAIVPTSSVKEITLVTDSALDQSSLTTANVKVTAGNAPVLGVIAPAGAKGFTFAFSAPVLSGQTYSFTATVKDTLGKILTVNAMFTTPAAPACPAPQVFTPGINACVYPMGVKVFGANTLPQGCNSASEQCWKDAVANGTVKFIATSATMVGVNNRPIVFAYYKNTSTGTLGGRSYTGLWNYLPIYADNGTITGADIYGGNMDEVDHVYTNAKGLIYHAKATNTCWDYTWYPPTNQPGVNSNVWSDYQPVICSQ